MATGALQHFDALSFAERLFVRGRLWTAPLRELSERAPAGKIADVGCGHGLLTALLASGRSDRTVVGLDPDEKKIAWATRALGGLSNVRLFRGRVEELAATEPGAFDAVVVADVLYLLPVEAWEGFLKSARSLLRPGGKLLLKEAEADGSWKHGKCVLQERLMVNLLGRTKGSGGLNFQPRGWTEELLAQSGFTVEETVDLSRGYSTPHVLFVARAR